MKILIAVIAYNEELNIKETLQDLIDNNKIGYDIVVVDNGSADSTKALAEEMGIPVVSHYINSGHSGGTVMTYFNYAYYYKYDILVQFDGDGQHIAEELPKIIEPVSKGYDYVIGSRFIEKKGFQSSGLRRIGIKMFSFIASKLIGQKITDITSGARAYSVKVIKTFAKHYRHEIYDTTQLLLVAYYSGAKINEYPIIMRERLHGSSEVNFIFAIGFIIKGLINIFGIVLQKSNLKHNGTKN
ncbi:MAG: glycosyltransferase family 2 protein [Saprospiraceae bacterium]|nr:glycosyltransferase family 2 protein [Saprospiraceae bacterium]